MYSFLFFCPKKTKKLVVVWSVLSPGKSAKTHQRIEVAWLSAPFGGLSIGFVEWCLSAEVTLNCGER